MLPPEMKSRARTNGLNASCGSVQASCIPAQGLRTGTGSFRRSACVRAQQLCGMAAVDMAHEGRVDGIADQLARALRQFAGNISGHGERHVLELAHPPRA